MVMVVVMKVMVEGDEDKDNDKDVGEHLMTHKSLEKDYAGRYSQVKTCYSYTDMDGHLLLDILASRCTCKYR